MASHASKKKKSRPTLLEMVCATNEIFIGICIVNVKGGHSVMGKHASS